jgi:flavin reductase (DIM6/NTAB) family NADH-FMN oxidoreductase RutF
MPTWFCFDREISIHANFYSYELRSAVNASALETWGDEFEEAGIKKASSRLVRPPRVADSPVSFEFRVHSIVRVANEAHGDEMAGPHLVGNSDIVIGRVVGIHIKGEYITGDGVGHFLLHPKRFSNVLQLFDVLKAAPIARNGYRYYSHINQVWNMDVPMMPDDKISSSVLAGSFAGLTVGDVKTITTQKNDDRKTGASRTDAVD